MNRFRIEVAGNSCSQKCSHCPHGRKLPDNPNLLSWKVDCINELNDLFGDISERIFLTLMDTPFESKIPFEKIEKQNIDLIGIHLGASPIDLEKSEKSLISQIVEMHSPDDKESDQKIPELSFGIGVHSLEELKDGMINFSIFLRNLFNELNKFEIERSSVGTVRLNLSINDWKDNSIDVLDNFQQWMEKGKELSGETSENIMNDLSLDYLSLEHPLTEFSDYVIGRRKLGIDQEEESAYSNYWIMDSEGLLISINLRVINRNILHQKESTISQVQDVLNNFRSGNVLLTIQPDGDFHLGHSTANIMNKALKISREEMRQLMKNGNANTIRRSLENHLENKYIELLEKDFFCD